MRFFKKTLIWILSCNVTLLLTACDGRFFYYNKEGCGPTYKTVKTVDEYGNPIEGIEVAVRHGDDNGFTSLGTYFTDENGEVIIRACSNTDTILIITDVDGEDNGGEFYIVDTYISTSEYSKEITLES